MKDVKKKLVKLLRWSQKYTKTDMLYAAKGGFWLITRKAGLSIVSFVLLAAFANLVSQETYGTYKYILSIVGIVSIVSLPGLRSSLIRSTARGKDGSLLAAFRISLLWGFIGSTILAGGAGWYFFQGNAVLGWSFLVAALFFSLYKATQLFGSYLQGKKEFKKFAKYTIIAQAVSALLIIATIYYTDNIIFIILAAYGSWTALHSIFYLLIRRRVKNKEADKETVPYGKSLTIMSAISTAAKHLDKIILWQFLGPAQVAVYSFAQQPVNKVQTFLPIKALALPKLSEKDMDEKRKSGMMNKFWRLLALSVVMAVGAIVLAPLVYQLVFPQYLDSVKYFQAFSLLFLLRPFALFGSSLTAEMKKREQYIVKSVSPVIQIILFLILIPLFGIWGAVIALLAGRAISSLLSLYFFKKIQPKGA